MKLLLLVSALLLLSTLTAEGTAVYDIDGEKLRPGTTYYITSAIRVAGGGGGLSLAPRDKWCPQYVIQHQSENNYGTPVTFSPINAGDEVVQLLTDLNIQFQTILAYCREVSPVWQLGDADESTGLRYVTSGGRTLGNPGAETVKNWFKIEKTGFAYQLMYCPSVCDSCDAPCEHLGIYGEHGIRWLGLSESPIWVVFIKANATAKA